MLLPGRVQGLSVRSTRGQRLWLEPLQEWRLLPPLLPQPIHLHLPTRLERWLVQPYKCLCHNCSFSFIYFFPSVHNSAYGIEVFDLDKILHTYWILSRYIILKSSTYVCTICWIRWDLRGARQLLDTALSQWRHLRVVGQRLQVHLPTGLQRAQLQHRRERVPWQLEQQPLPPRPVYQHLRKLQVSVGRATSMLYVKNQLQASVWWARWPV